MTPLIDVKQKYLNKGPQRRSWFVRNMMKTFYVLHPCH